MSAPTDQNDVVSKAISDLIQSSFKSIANAATDRMRTAWLKISEDFTPFMKECYKRNRYVKILCHKDTDIDLYDAYVNTTFSNSENTLSDEELIQKVNEQANLIINGNGGTGKTFFMRHLWINLLEHSPRTPIFIELRHLNYLSSPDLATFIRNSISSTGNLPEEVFDYFCDYGRFCFVLDGFDEIAEENQGSIEHQIISLSDRYPECSFVISSRFDGRFSGWHGFEVFDTDPFTLEQVKELCSKIPFDQKSKTLFLRKLDDKGFFEKHESFLSNPLLAMMMMMTFKDNMDIPGKMSIFYEQAFNTLFQWHDSTKLYLRKKTLDINEFQNSFSTFSLLSYYNQIFEFTKSAIIENIEKSNKACGIKKDPEKILYDYEKSVNLIKQDGLNYVFVHRSFQEYFSSVALTGIFSTKFSEFLPNLIRRHSDNVLSMCYELRSDLVVDELINPLHEKFSESIFQSKTKENPQFYYLSKINAQYKVYIDITKNKNGSQSCRVSFGVDTDTGIIREISALHKLQSREATQFDFAHRILIPDAKFPDIDKWMRQNSIEARTVEMTSSFDDNEMQLLFHTENQDEQKISKEEEFFIEFEEFSRQANIGIGNALTQLGKWCKKTSETRKKQDKSIDEIFNW